MLGKCLEELGSLAGLFRNGQIHHTRVGFADISEVEEVGAAWTLGCLGVLEDRQLVTPTQEVFVVKLLGRRIVDCLVISIFVCLDLLLVLIDVFLQ